MEPDLVQHLLTDVLKDLLPGPFFDLPSYMSADVVTGLVPEMPPDPFCEIEPDLVPGMVLDLVPELVQVFRSATSWEQIQHHIWYQSWYQI